MVKETARPITSTIFPPETSHFAAFAPTWAGIHDENRLRGMLVLAALFNQSVYIHDTQLTDNPHLLRSYLLRADNKGNLFSLLSGLIRAGVVHVGLRDATYIASKDTFHSCENLRDVYDSWIRQGISAAWMTPQVSQGRLPLIKHLDGLLKDARVLQYPYVEVKKGFMGRVRLAVTRKAEPHYIQFSNLPAELRKQYLNVLMKDWFSYSDILAVLCAFGLTLRSPFLQTHGLFDEVAYARWNQIRLFGCDSPNWKPEEALSPDLRPPRSLPEVDLTHLELQSKALRFIEAPGLTLLGTLEADEVLRLREEAAALFRFISFYREGEKTFDVSEFRDAYLDAVTEYWHNICAYIRKTRPYISERRSRIAVFANSHLPKSSRWIGRHVSHTLNVGLDVLSSIFASSNALSVDSRKKIVDALSLRVVFFTDTVAMKNLKQAIPSKMWTSRDGLGLLDDPIP